MLIKSTTKENLTLDLEKAIISISITIALPLITTYALVDKSIKVTPKEIQILENSIGEKILRVKFSKSHRHGKLETNSYYLIFSL